MSLGYTHFADYIEQQFDLGVNHRVEIIFTKNTLETDNNLIFNFMANDVKEFFTFDVKHTEVERLENLAQMEIVFDISFSRFEKNHTRSYEKLDSTLANIQAVTAIIDWLFAMMLGYFNSNSMEKYLANKVYLVQNSNSNNDYNSIKVSHNRQGSVITNVPFNNINANNTNNNIDQSLKVELKNSKENKLEIKSDTNRNDNYYKEEPDIIELNSQSPSIKFNNYQDNLSNDSKKKSINNGKGNISPINTQKKITLKIDQAKTKLERSKIKINQSQILGYEDFSCCMNKNKNNKVYQEFLKLNLASIYLADDLDIINYLKQKQEFEYIKEMLLNENERFLLKGICPRRVHSNIEAEKVEEILEEKNYEHLKPDYNEKFCKALEQMANSNSNINNNDKNEKESLLNKQLARQIDIFINDN